MAMGPSTLALSPSGLPGYSPPVGCGLAPTIRHNVTMGDLGLEDDDARFWAAIRACGLEADLAGWPSLRGRPRWGGGGDPDARSLIGDVGPCRSIRRLWIR